MLYVKFRAVLFSEIQNSGDAKVPPVTPLTTALRYVPACFKFLTQALLLIAPPESKS